MPKSGITTKKEHPFAERAVPRFLQLSALIIATLLLMGGGWFVVLRSQTKSRGGAPPSAVLSPPYAYESPSEPLGIVALSLVYVIASDRTDAMPRAEWQKELDITAFLEKVARFHSVQFEGRSRIVWRLAPELVVGVLTAAEYGGENTNEGNPEALLKLRKEIEDRLERGDLRLPEFQEPVPRDAFPVLAIVVSDVGLAGTKGAILLSDAYFLDPAYQASGPSLFWHELGHAFGIPDLYQYDAVFNREHVLNGDIMGGGRERSIDYAHLSDEVKQNMGL